MLYKDLIRPILFLRDPEISHEHTLRLLSKLGFLRPTLERLLTVQDHRLAVKLGPLTLRNPIGLAAGFDKNGIAVRIWPGFGFGFFEIGAVTAQAQPGNPKPRLLRLPEDEALINRLGFNNEGAEAIAARLAQYRKNGAASKIPLGVNIGRTKIVENKDATRDYLTTFERLFPFGDYFTLNVSSPNTPGLRELQKKNNLLELLDAISSRNRELAKRAETSEKPIFVKIDPDMELSQLDEVIEIVESKKINGIIATNATEFMRESLTTKTDEPGGLSGKPIRARATAFIRHVYRATKGQLPIIGVGGIFTAEDSYEKITAGATAVQIYTGFVYEGPSAVKRINQGLLMLLERDGFDKISDAVGSQSRFD